MALLRPAILACLLALAVIHLPAEGAAGRIERACVSSERAGGDRRLCGCIQRIADQLLTGPDQRLAATFFKDPHRAQQIRQSDRARDEAFWQRYTRFGALAQQSCR